MDLYLITYWLTGQSPPYIAVMPIVILSLAMSMVLTVAMIWSMFE